MVLEEDAAEIMLGGRKGCTGKLQNRPTLKPQHNNKKAHGKKFSRKWSENLSEM